MPAPSPDLFSPALPLHPKPRPLPKASESRSPPERSPASARPQPPASCCPGAFPRQSVRPFPNQMSYPCRQASASRLNPKPMCPSSLLRAESLRVDSSPILQNPTPACESPLHPHQRTSWAAPSKISPVWEEGTHPSPLRPQGARRHHSPPQNKSAFQLTQLLKVHPPDQVHSHEQTPQSSPRSPAASPQSPAPPPR